MLYNNYMKPELFVCRYDLAQRLDDLGIRIESHYQWNVACTGDEKVITLVEDQNYESKGDDGGTYLVYAPTAEELANVLPVVLEDDETLKKNGGALFLHITKPYECGTDAEYTESEMELLFGRYIVGYSSTRPESTEAVSRGDDKLADAMAKAVILLAETKRFKWPAE